MAARIQGQFVFAVHDRSADGQQGDVAQFVVLARQTHQREPIEQGQAGGESTRETYHSARRFYLP